MPIRLVFRVPRGGNWTLDIWEVSLLKGRVCCKGTAVWVISFLRIWKFSLQEFIRTQERRVISLESELWALKAMGTNFGTYSCSILRGSVAWRLSTWALQANCLGCSALPWPAVSLRVSYLTSLCPHFLIYIIALIAGPVPQHCSES